MCEHGAGSQAPKARWQTGLAYIGRRRVVFPGSSHEAPMTLSPPDLAALAFFVVAWIAYATLIEGTAHGKGGLNAQMDIHRET
jgi:hypothetical protein